MLCGPFGGPRVSVEKPWLRRYQSLVCVLDDKMLILTFISPQLIFLPKKSALFLFSPPHKENFKENTSGFKLFPGF